MPRPPESSVRGRRLGLFAGLVLAIVASAPAALASTDDAPEMTPEALLGARSTPLALSDAQRERIDQIVTESREYAELLKSELAEAQADLKRRLDGPDPDFDAVMREVDRVGELETRLRKHQIATLMSLRALLSPEQRAGLAKILRMASHSSRATRRASAPGEADEGEASARAAGTTTPAASTP
jgi:Spy/CpxP family protein refolding chaperone